MTAAAAVHGVTSVPRADAGVMAMARAVAVCEGEPGELAQRAAHAAYMERAYEYARALLADLAGARRRATAALN